MPRSAFDSRRDTQRPRRARAAARRGGALAGLALLVAGTVPLVADVVHLKSGRPLEGEVRSGADDAMVEVRIGSGTIVRVPRGDILRIESKPSPAQVFDARFTSAPPGDIEPLVELLVMAREKRLRARATKAAQRILRIDPHHELARWTLGYVVFQNRWVLDAELRKKKDLVRIDGEWMTREDYERRQRDEARREMLELLALVESDNRRIRSYAVKEVRRRARGGDPLVVEALAEGLADRRVAVRLIAVAELGRPGAGSLLARRDADRVARRLHRLALEETHPTVRETLFGTAARPGTLATFHPRENFRRALGAAPGVEAPDQVERLAAVIVSTVQKAWVPELCRALAADGPRRPAVLAALKAIFQADFGYDAARWLEHWELRKGDFRDVQ